MDRSSESDWDLQDILSDGLKAFVLICIWWRLLHVLKGLMKDSIPARELKWFGIDGVVLGLGGGVLTSAGVGQSLSWALAGGVGFYTLASLGFTISEDDPGAPGNSQS